MPDASRRGGDAVDISADVGIGRAVRLVVQVVELGDRGVAGLQHLDVELRGDGLDLVGRRACRRSRTSPRARSRSCPRRVGRARFGQARHRALEGVAVQVRHAGNGRRRRAAWRRSCAAAPGVTATMSPAADDLDAHVARPAARAAAPSARERPSIAVLDTGPLPVPAQGTITEPAERRLIQPAVTTTCGTGSMARLPPRDDGAGRRSPTARSRTARSASRTAASPGSGRAAELPDRPERRRETRRSAAGRWITPGPDRLPHPPRLRRRPRARVRAAPRGRDLRGDRPGRRRHRLDRRARRAQASEDELVAAAPAPARRAAGRRRHHHRDQVGLRPRRRRTS